MIVSMTGYGSAHAERNGVSYAVEIRSVNNRYLKLSTKLPEPLQFAESEVEKLVRQRVARGSVSCVLRVRDATLAGCGTINVPAVQGYLQQLSRVALPPGVAATFDLATAATLPGVMDPADLDDETCGNQSAVIAEVVGRALDALVSMRKEEGRSLANDLAGCVKQIHAELDAVAARAPTVIDEYHQRLRARVQTLLQTAQLELESESLMREVAVFAERCDISEEVSRVRSHLDQFDELCRRGDQVGRTMDFLAQELLREANTIGSKSSDAAIARSVVQMKGCIDRLKEQVQNVE